MPATRILHIDVDAFAAEVARVCNASLRGKPLVVANEVGGRGFVTCSSYEARALGVYPGMTLFTARRKASGACFVGEQPALYEDFSQRLLAFLVDQAPAVEATSLDDFYLDLTGCERLYGGDLVKWSVGLQRRLLATTGLPVSMGLAGNKMIARIATALAKPRHILHILNEKEREFLDCVPVRLLPGVGEQTRTRLHEFGIRRVGQIHALGEEFLRATFGPRGTDLWNRSAGRFNEPVKPTALHKYLSCEHAFPGDTAEIELIESAACLLAQKLAAMLREQAVRTAVAELALIYTDGIRVQRQMRLPYPSDQDFDFLAPARDSVRALFKRRVRVREMRLRAPFIPNQDGQFDLFIETTQRRQDALYTAMDKVHARHGFLSLISARSLRSTRQPNPPPKSH